MRESRIPRPVFDPQPSTSATLTAIERTAASKKRPHPKTSSCDSLASSATAPRKIKTARSRQDPPSSPTTVWQKAKQALVEDQFVQQAQAQPQATPTRDTNEDLAGFTLVQSKKGKKRAGNPATSNPFPAQTLSNQQPPQPANQQPAQPANQQPPQPANRRAPPTPKPRRVLPPSVSVATPYQPRSQRQAFRIPKQATFATSYEAVAALEEDLPELKMRNIIGRDESTVLIPQDDNTVQLLLAVAQDEAAIVKVMPLSSETQTTKGIVMGYPFRMPTELLLRHPNIETAERCKRSRTQEDTRQVLVTVRGSLPASVDLGNWGTYYLRPYTPEPLRCYRCQKFGHHQSSCNRQTTCGICSGKHDTSVCLNRFKAKEEVVHKCPNCGGRHHAWNPSCPARIQRVDWGRERQVQWVRDQQATSMTPAPAGTFVWGTQKKASAPQPQLATAHFPPLPPSTFHSATTTQQPAGETQHATTPAPAPAPTAPQQSTAHITLSREDLEDFGRELALGVAKCIVTMLKAKVDDEALENTVKKIVTRAADKFAPQTSKIKQASSKARSANQRAGAGEVEPLPPRPTPRRGPIASQSDTEMLRHHNSAANQLASAFFNGIA